METKKETNNVTKDITWLKNPTGRRQTSWLFTRVTEELNSGQQRTSGNGI